MMIPKNSRSGDKIILFVTFNDSIQIHVIMLEDLLNVTDKKCNNLQATDISTIDKLILW